MNPCFYLPGPVVVEEGSDVILPCSLSSINIESKLFDWKKDGQKEVFLYDEGHHYNKDRTGQDEHFKGRVSHFQDQLKRGNASIIIRNTKVSDSGNYTCAFPRLQPSQIFHIKLVVGECFHQTLQDGRSFTDATALRVPHGLLSSGHNTHVAEPGPHTAAATSGLITSVSNMPDISDTLSMMSLCTMKCHQSIVDEI